MSAHAPAALTAAAALMGLVAADRSAKGRPPAPEGRRTGGPRGEIGGEVRRSDEVSGGEAARSPATRRLPTGLY